MDIYVVEYQNFSNFETKVTLFATEKDALTQALKDARKHIDRKWELGDEDTAACLEEINELEANGNLRGALDKFNDREGDMYDSTFWMVYPERVIGFDEPSAHKITYKATASGATCRGSCKNYNEYAYADQPDGTYVCYQCSMFKHILGLT